MNQRNNDDIEINIKELFFVLMRNWYVIVIVGILAALITGLVSKFLITPVYTSTSKLYIINRQQDDITTWSDMESGEFLVKDYRVLVKSRPVTEKVIKDLNLNLTNEELASMISITTPEGTRILEIEIIYKDPKMAKSLVDEIAKVSIEQLEEIMEIKKINIVEEGNLPESPTGPKVAVNTILGGALGLFITSFFMLIMHIVNDTIRTAKDIEKYLGLTMIGVIPLDDESWLQRKKKNINPVRKIKKSTHEISKEDRDAAGNI